MRNENATIQTEHSKDDIKTKHCIACMELIHKDAKICPFCRSSQHIAPLSITVNIIKWIAGITALASLVLAVTQLNIYFEGWREKRELVNELIAAAKIQKESGDYMQALSLLDEATQLEPSSRNSRQAKVQLAMTLVRTKRAWQKDTVEVVNKLLPIMVRGAASSDVLVAADVNAHIGWAYILMTGATQSKFSIDNYFDRALQQDNNNAYAHAFWGYWALSRYNKQKYDISNNQKAIAHFNKAVTSGKDLKLIRYLQISALSEKRDIETILEAFKVAFRIKKRNEKLEPSVNYKLIRLFDYFNYDYKFAVDLTKSVLANFDPKELLETFKWLYAKIEDKNSPGNVEYERYNFTIAYLTAAAGEEENALNLFKSLKFKLRDRSGYHADIDKETNKIRAGFSETVERSQTR